VFHVLTLTYQKPPELIDEARPAHLAWIENEVDAGRLILTGRLESQQGGVLVTADISVEAADELINSDPYQLAGLVHYERVSFTGGRRAPGLLT
jgi:uncharacterized protein YciI